MVAVSLFLRLTERHLGRLAVLHRFRRACAGDLVRRQPAQDRRRMALALGRSLDANETLEFLKMALLEIKNLHAGIDGKEILRGLDLTVNAGEVHAIMGPNGSGKSTLAYVLAGKDGYEPTAGEVLFDGKNLFDMAAGRARCRRPVSRFPVSAGDPRRRHHDVPAHRAQRAAQEARRGRAVDAGIHQEGARDRRQARHRTGHAAPRRQCRLFRRREEAQRGSADGAARAAACRARRDQFRARHRRAENRRRRRQPAALAPARASS